MCQSSSQSQARVGRWMSSICLSCWHKKWFFKIFFVYNKIHQYMNKNKIFLLPVEDDWSEQNQRFSYIQYGTVPYPTVPVVTVQQSNVLDLYSFIGSEFTFFNSKKLERKKTWIEQPTLQHKLRFLLIYFFTAWIWTHWRVKTTANHPYRKRDQRGNGNEASLLVINTCNPSMLE